VSRFLIPHAWRIADATVEEMPQINWGVEGLAATYRGLCAGCTKTGTQSILLGCPFLLHLWSYNRLPVGRPSVDRSPYQVLQEGHGPVDRPTMGSMWCHLQVRYFELTSFVSYLKVMHIVELTHFLVCSSLGRSRPGGRTWTSSARSSTSRTARLSSSCSPTPWSPHVHRRVCLPCAFGTMTSG
jgi:hypothetical protein